MNNPRYVVIGEHSLGYVTQGDYHGMTTVQRLGTSVLKGGEPLPAIEGPRTYATDSLRDAVDADYDTFRVSNPHKRRPMFDCPACGCFHS